MSGRRIGVRECRGLGIAVPPPAPRKKTADAAPPPVVPPIVPVVEMAYANTAAATRQFNPKDKLLIHAFKEFTGNPDDDVEQWVDEYHALDA